MKKNLGFTLIYTVIAGVVALQILFLIAEFDPYFRHTYDATINYLICIYYIIIYFAVSVLIWIEIKHIEEFHIDKFTLIIFILSALFRRRLGINGENYFLILIGLTGISTIVALIVNKPEISRTNLRWALTGVVVGGVALIPITLLESLLRGSWLPTPLYQNNVVVTVIRQIVYEFSFTAPIEEILYRGFLWGYLRRKGWAENKIFWGQGVLFWLLHLSRFVTPFTFFLIIPLLTLISSKLTLRSKQVFPAILSHTVINTIGAILNLATY
jgi:membrane protease YdiL (CAAX protease family)